MICITNWQAHDYYVNWNIFNDDPKRKKLKPYHQQDQNRNPCIIFFCFLGLRKRREGTVSIYINKYA